MKWEYCQIIDFGNAPQDVIQRLGAKPILKFLTPKGVEVNAAHIDNVEITLAQLGIDGWELLSHTQIMTSAGILVPAMEVYYLKRPIAA